MDAAFSAQTRMPAVPGVAPAPQELAVLAYEQR